jgi:hypothetical protein
MKNIQKYFLFICLLSGIACQKDLQKVYEVNRQQVSLTTINKDNFKQELSLISLAHTDLFGSPIEGWRLTQCIEDFAATNDKEAMLDLILRGFLNQSNLPMPTDTQMRNDLEDFVKTTYQKFYHREPSPFEAFKLKQMIENDASLKPSMLYYSFLTSDEYRYF